MVFPMAPDRMVFPDRMAPDTMVLPDGMFLPDRMVLPDRISIPLGPGRRWIPTQLLAICAFLVPAALSPPSPSGERESHRITGLSLWRGCQIHIHLYMDVYIKCVYTHIVLHIHIYVWIERGRKLYLRFARCNRGKPQCEYPVFLLVSLCLPFSISLLSLLSLSISHLWSFVCVYASATPSRVPVIGLHKQTQTYLLCTYTYSYIHTPIALFKQILSLMSAPSFSHF